MRSIKNKELITQGYCDRLAEWIKENTAEFFSKDNEAGSWEHFNIFPTKKMDRNHLILKGEICIIDRNWDGVHAYVVCEMKKTGVKNLFKVINVEELRGKYWKNGYFLIPDLNSIKE